MRGQYTTVALSIWFILAGCESMPRLRAVSVEPNPDAENSTDFTHQVSFQLTNVTPKTYWVFKDSLGPAYTWINHSDTDAEEKPGSFCGTFLVPQPLRPGSSWTFLQLADKGYELQVAVTLYADEASAQANRCGLQIWSDRVPVPITD